MHIEDSHLADDIRGQLYKAGSTLKPVFQGVMECLMECAIRNTEPAYYDVAIRNDGLVVAREYPGAEWRTVGDDIHEKYTYTEMKIDILDFCYKWDMSFLERKFLMNFIEGLIVKDYKLFDK